MAMNGQNSWNLSSYKKRKRIFLDLGILVVKLGSVLLPNVVLSLNTTSSKESCLVSFLKLYKISFGTTVKQVKLDLLTTLNSMKVWMTCHSSSFLPTNVILSLQNKVTNSRPSQKKLMLKMNYSFMFILLLKWKKSCWKYSLCVLVVILVFKLNLPPVRSCVCTWCWC